MDSTASSRALGASSCSALRNLAVHRHGKDVAAEIAKKSDGAELIDAAIIVVGRARQGEKEVLPKLTKEQASEIAQRPRLTHLISEDRFWRTVRNRFEAIKAGTATGDTDARLMLYWVDEQGKEYRKDKKANPFIRVSWRKSMNWADVPTLLLEASSQEKIVGKLFGRDPKVVDVPAPLHVRTIASIESTYATAISSTTP